MQYNCSFQEILCTRDLSLKYFLYNGRYGRGKTAVLSMSKMVMFLGSSYYDVTASKFTITLNTKVDLRDMKLRKLRESIKICPNNENDSAYLLIDIFKKRQVYELYDLCHDDDPILYAYRMLSDQFDRVFSLLSDNRIKNLDDRKIELSKFYGEIDIRNNVIEFKEEPLSVLNHMYEWLFNECNEDGLNELDNVLMK